jgi:hypothetical protein
MAKNQKQLNDEALHPSDEVVGLSKSELDAYLGETVASDTLKAKTETQPTTTAQAEALAAFMKLSPEDKNDFLQKALDDSAGDFGAVDYAENNRASLKTAQNGAFLRVCHEPQEAREP